MKYLAQIHSWAFIQYLISENYSLSLYLVGIHNPSLMIKLPLTLIWYCRTESLLHPLSFSHFNSVRVPLCCISMFLPILISCLFNNHPWWGDNSLWFWFSLSWCDVEHFLNVSVGHLCVFFGKKKSIQAFAHF